jgi:hypothetical protein
MKLIVLNDADFAWRCSLFGLGLERNWRSHHHRVTSKAYRACGNNGAQVHTRAEKWKCTKNENGPGGEANPRGAILTGNCPEKTALLDQYIGCPFKARCRRWRGLWWFGVVWPGGALQSVNWPIDRRLGLMSAAWGAMIWPGRNEVESVRGLSSQKLLEVVRLALGRRLLSRGRDREAVGRGLGSAQLGDRHHRSKYDTASRDALHRRRARPARREILFADARQARLVG